MTDHEPFVELQQVLKDMRSWRSRTDAGTADCLDDDTLAALAEGRLDAAARAAALAHLAVCARCRGVVASVARALDDPAVAREARAVHGAGRRSFLRVLVPAAAAAILVLLAWPPPRPNGEPPHRAPTITAIPAPGGMVPFGPVAAVEVLRWSPVAGADRYRVTLFDADGRVLYEMELGDTIVPLPDSIVFLRGRTYLWKVEARTGFDRWSGSELVEFSVVEGTPR